MASNLTRNTLVNLVFLQGLWFATIIGAAHQQLIPATVWFVLFTCCFFLGGENRRQDAAIVIVATLFGFAFDSIWVQLGWITFAHTEPYANMAPWWIAMLWAALGLTINYSLRWLQNRLMLAALLCAISGPLSYYAASNLGALTIEFPLALYIALSSSWALFIPLVLGVAKNMPRPQILGQPL